MAVVARAPEQDAFPSFYDPAIHFLNDNNGVMRKPFEDIEHHDIRTKITLGRLAHLYGQTLGPTKGVNYDGDKILEITREDFYRAHPNSIILGLVIARNDSRYMDRSTQQLVRIPKHKSEPGIVFPEDEFLTITYSPSGMAARVMAGTRAANKGEPDIDEKVLRSAGHALDSKIKSLTKLDNSLEYLRVNTIAPIQEEAYRNGNRHWQAHYSPKNIDALRLEVDERYHEAIDIAAINWNIGSKALKAAHRAAASALYRTPDSEKRTQNWAVCANFLRGYIIARQEKIRTATQECQTQLDVYQPFLDKNSL